MISNRLDRAAGSIDETAKRMHMDSTGYPPIEFFKIRHDATPRAPVRGLIKWAILCYSSLGFITVYLFYTEWKKDIITTYVKANTDDDTMQCTASNQCKRNKYFYRTKWTSAATKCFLNSQTV